MNALAALDTRAISALPAAAAPANLSARPAENQPSPAPKTLGATPVGATPPQQNLLPPRLVIELDEAAERFVQTLMDGAGETLLRRYPDEGQLAFSRGVTAYMAAVSRG
jgi:hypothetical protein